MFDIMNEILAVVAPAVDITLVATTGLLIAVKKNKLKWTQNHVIQHFTCTSKFRPQKQLSIVMGNLKAKFLHFIMCIHK